LRLPSKKSAGMMAKGNGEMAKRALHAVGALTVAAVLTAIFAATGPTRAGWTGTPDIKAGATVARR